MLFVFSEILVHFTSSGVVRFHGAEAVCELSLMMYQVVPDAIVVHGTPAVPDNPSTCSWQSSVSGKRLVELISHGLTVSPDCGLMT